MSGFSVFPIRYKTIISQLEIDEVTFLLSSVTERPSAYWMPEIRAKEIKGLKKFQGYVHDGSFRLSKRVYYPQAFIPLLIGELDSSTSGTILRIKIKLFKNTRLGIMFSCFMLFAMSGVLFYSGMIIWPLLCVLSVFIVFGIAWANFNIHSRDSLKELENALSLD